MFQLLPVPIYYSQAATVGLSVWPNCGHNCGHVAQADLGGAKGAMPPQDAKSRPIAHRLQYNLKF